MCSSVKSVRLIVSSWREWLCYSKRIERVILKYLDGLVKVCGKAREPQTNCRKWWICGDVCEYMWLKRKMEGFYLWFLFHAKARLEAPLDIHCHVRCVVAFRLGVVFHDCTLMVTRFSHLLEPIFTSLVTVLLVFAFLYTWTPTYYAKGKITHKYLTSRVFEELLKVPFQIRYTLHHVVTKSIPIPG